MSERFVTVKNISSGSVGIVVPSRNFRRSANPNGNIIIPFDILQEGLYSEPANEYLFKHGFVYIENAQDRIDLGLEEMPVYEDKAMLELANCGDPIKVKKALEEMGSEQAQKFAKILIENEIYTAGLAKIVKDITNIDLLVAIKNKKDAED